MFGRKGTTSDNAPPSHLYPDHLYDGPEPDDQPFGEDIKAPDRRAIPPEFLGEWKGEGGLSPVVAEPLWLTFGGLRQPVVAVREIKPQEPESYDREIAIVTQAMDKGKWKHALIYLGVSPNGQRMTDLESMDCRWTRV